MYTNRPLSWIKIHSNLSLALTPQENQCVF